MSSELFQNAIDKVTIAIKLDNEKKYKDALEHYQQALQMLIVVLKYEKNEKTKQLLSQRVHQYMSRAEELRKTVEQKQAVTVQEEEDKKVKEDKFQITKLEKKISWNDVAGLENAKKALQEAVILPIKFPNLFANGREAWKGILLYGSPGTGKSFLAKVVASVSNSSFYSISSSDIVSKWLGESEKAIKDLFSEARANSPSVIFIDEIDSLCGERTDNENDATRRIKTEILIQMDGVGKDNNNVLVLAATNTPWSLDPAFRRRFQKRIYIPLPNKHARKKIIQSYLSKCDNCVEDNELDQLALLTEGFSGSDISNLMKDALMEPIRKLQHAKQFILKDNNKWSICEYYPNCPQCPPDLTSEPSMNKECTNCGAVRKDLFDINENDIEIPIISYQDIRNSMKNITKTVSDSDLKKYEDWTLQYGVNGVV